MKRISTSRNNTILHDFRNLKYVDIQMPTESVQPGNDHSHFLASTFSDIPIYMRATLATVTNEYSNVVGAYLTELNNNTARLRGPDSVRSQVARHSLKDD